MAWDPQLYLRFGRHRLRPALDLLAQVSVDPSRVVDLGSGTGVVSRIMADRWPAAEVVGIDNSHPMLETARTEHPALTFIEADAATWAADPKVDLLYSNAALHWLDDHDELLPRLLGQVAPGGQFAVQMPLNHHEPAWRLVDEVARSGPWSATLAPLLRPFPVAEPAVYHALLDPLTSDLSVWETTYVQKVVGEDPVASWVKGSFLRPLLAALDEPSADAFFLAYAERVADAYPLDADGAAILPFRRVFLVATR